MPERRFVTEFSLSSVFLRSISDLPPTNSLGVMASVESGRVFP